MGSVYEMDPWRPIHYINTSQRKIILRNYNVRLNREYKKIVQMYFNTRFWLCKQIPNASDMFTWACFISNLLYGKFCCEYLLWNRPQVSYCDCLPGRGFRWFINHVVQFTHIYYDIFMYFYRSSYLKQSYWIPSCNLST